MLRVALKAPANRWGFLRLGDVMASLSNPKHERFAQGLAKGKTQEQAYVEAGYAETGARGHSARLMVANGSIAKRVSELQERGAIRTELTIQDMIDELEEAREFAKANGHSATLVAATMGKSKLLGLVVEKREDITPHDEQRDQLERRLSRIIAGSTKTSVPREPIH